LSKFNRKIEILEDELISMDKKRGRKKMEDDDYYLATNDKIQEWEEMLKQKGLSKKEKKAIRNRISAQRSRNKKKEEQLTMQQQIDALRLKYK
jgi:hypothetical protein